jgi:glycosyltransferase involved in cell wall biosynthesis
MKFTIITHAIHKKHKHKLYAYEPYVREMNLWLPFVDEVEIVAPFSEEGITAIESSYHLATNDELLKQVQHDGSERHSECNEASLPNEQITSSQTPRNDGIILTKIASFDINTFPNALKAILKIPKICYQIYKAMQWADHIHVRCPGNIGLLGCLVQILFPNKPKTVKYAGNWNPKSKQPLSYKLQKWIVSNTFLTKNCKVLVYGKWPNQSKKIVPFFTASYSEKEIEVVEIRNISGYNEQIAASRIPRNDELEEEQILNQVQHDGSGRHPQLVPIAIGRESHDELLKQVQHDGSRHSAMNRHPEFSSGSPACNLKFIYVGGLVPGKQPLLTVQVVHELKRKGYNVQLDMYGEGVERAKITNYILDNSLEGVIYLHGNTSKEIVKKAYQQAHFLIFISKSEGWPKVVAEAMFWGCIPITSDVSCVSEMLGNGTRGTIVKPSVAEIVATIEKYLNNSDAYISQAKNAMHWSRQYTLDKFEKEIKKLL